MLGCVSQDAYKGLIPVELPALVPGVVTEEALLVICDMASNHASDEDPDCRLDAM